MYPSLERKKCHCAWSLLPNDTKALPFFCVKSLRFFLSQLWNCGWFFFVSDSSRCHSLWENIRNSKEQLSTPFWGRKSFGEEKLSMKQREIKDWATLLILFRYPSHSSFVRKLKSGSKIASLRDWLLFTSRGKLGKYFERKAGVQKNISCVKNVRRGSTINFTRKLFSPFLHPKLKND